MKTEQSGFLLGIGSNINPDENFKQIIVLLLNSFPSLSLSRVLRIPPIGMNSHRDFLNTVVFIETSQSEQDLKAICNAIEIKLGRDRNDPARKMKDRPADLDILTHISFPDDKQREPADITDEYFIYPLLEELFAFLTGSDQPAQQPGVSLSTEGLTFGQTATTIHRHTSTSDKRVS